MLNKHVISYGIEVLFLTTILVSGLRFVDAYAHLRNHQEDFKLKSTLNELAVELAIEAVSSRSQRTHHLDRYAEKQFEFEQILQKLPTTDQRESKLNPLLKQFMENVTNYIQLSTMLKTSLKFVAQFDLENTGMSNAQRTQTLDIIATVSALENSISIDKKEQIKKQLLLKLETLPDIHHTNNALWYMFKIHTKFIADNLLRSDQFLDPIQKTEFNTVLTNELSRLNSFQEHHYWNMVFYGFSFVASIFGLLLTSILRQSFQLHLANHKARKSAQAKARFLANMSHEIRTPMNGIMGLSDILLNTELTSRQRSHLEKIKFSVKSLTTIINDILDFSKIESENLNLEIVEFDLSDLLDNIKAMLSNSASEKGLEFVIDCDKKLQPTYQGDPVRIGQILLNLTSNAIKFTPKGSVILQLVPVEQQSHQDIVAFSVIDTGIGIAQDQIDTLFQRFTQAESSTTRKYGGTGLGLSICKMLTELMGGNIVAKSELGKGSEFCVTLPLSHSQGNLIESSPASFKGEQLLIIEDNIITQEITQKFAEDAGLNVTVASLAKEGLSKLDESFYSFILIDWVLPDMHGYEVVEYARHHSPNSHILVFTSYDKENIEVEKEIAILTKPILREDLIHALKESQVRKENGKHNDINTELDIDSQSDNEAESTAIKLDSPIHSDEPNNISSTLKVLIADDNDINLFVAQEILMELNVEVTTAENGKIAVERILNNAFDLVLMDIQMPEMDGIEATIKIREHFSPHQLPIYALTANVLEDEVRSYEKAGMNGHLGKPFEADEIIELVGSYIR
ncbi:response regulator [Marinibactrum halimedae]|uniref:Sensory/regulatory protein RpfC n=1 Tax=Marinibactrum halimedae TaxID=1444977 RepID=A0AA37TB53_9GAMM|nr:response regulator [Marinibactrum halimedae]MCD9459533.1 response regulator [Marinibactrum halimedae]GLS28187.1 hypothetical protein GCM10007877_39060 [Marinibactrum halimedae]